MSFLIILLPISDKIQKVQGTSMKVRTTIISNILKGDLDAFFYLRELQIEANHYLKYLEPGLFRNMSKLEQLSISYNTGLKSLRDGTFQGLINLRNLSLVNNMFININNLAILLKVNILPSLIRLDISENPLVTILKNDLCSLQGSMLQSLKINLCSLEYVHQDSFLSLHMLNDLYIGQNNLNASLIQTFLNKMYMASINLTLIDLSGLGFRKQPPRMLMDTIAVTSIARLILADNHFKIIPDGTFPRMENIKEIDLRRVRAIDIGPSAFDSIKFPNLQVLLLSGNNLLGLYQKVIPSRTLSVLDLSYNGDRTSDISYYDIDKNAFLNYKQLRVLNLSHNALKSIHNYTFKGLVNLRVLNLENSSIYFAEVGSFKPMRHLKQLNLANNPLGRVVNITGSIFDGLNELKVLVLRSCGINGFYEHDNIFERLPNITTLILNKNQLQSITAEILKPLKKLEILDLRDNILVSWWMPLFLTYGVRPSSVYFTNNKITMFTESMLLDINYLLENRGNISVNINFMSNVFVCDCNSMYGMYIWLKVNGSKVIKGYFNNSNIRCNSDVAQGDRRVAVYLKTISTAACSINGKASITVMLIWSAPVLIFIIFAALLVILLYKYRLHISYWIFICKVELDRKFFRRRLQVDTSRQNGYKYDAFVSYSNEDKDFVTLMISHLESTSPYLKLCIFERDFEIGSFISESVYNSINESKYIILVISNSFAKSQWCRWETNLAEYHRLLLEDGTSYDPLVLIRIGDIDSKLLTTNLKYLLKTKIYLMWNDRHPEKFWEKLRNLLIN